MKAWRIPSFGIDNLSLDELADPQPAYGEVLVKVHAVSLNYRDLMVVKGLYNPRLRFPRIPCSDGAGVVAAVGEGVKTVKVGDRVAGIFMQNWIEGAPSAAKQKGALGGDIDGMLAELVVLPEHGVVPLPSHLSLGESATLPCAGVTAWNAVVGAGRSRPGQTILIQGTGGVSIFALQFGKALGARVMGTSSSDEKLARAAGLGLDGGLNYREHPDWDKWALEQTGGGVDLVVEVGGAGTLAKSLQAIKIGGVIAQIGILAGVEQALPIASILHKQVQLQGIYVGSREDFLEMNRAISQLGLKPVISEVVPFGEARQAFEIMESGSHFGKIVVQIGSKGNPLEAPGNPKGV
jgi:NADPH:quinone reductase-like Zn-dependent oxidoreductase